MKNQEINYDQAIKEAIQLYRSAACPADARLESYTRGELSWLAGYRVARHLRTCPACMSFTGRQWPAHARTRRSVRLARRQTAQPLAAALLLCAAVFPTLMLSRPHVKPLTHVRPLADVKPLAHNGPADTGGHGGKAADGMGGVQEKDSFNLKDADVDLRKKLNDISLDVHAGDKHLDQGTIALFDYQLALGYGELYRRHGETRDLQRARAAYKDFQVADPLK